jgi:hypothetical protein
MNEIETIKLISDAFETLQAEERVRVLGWAQAKYGGSRVSPLPPQGDVQSRPNNSRDALPKARASKKAKTIMSMDKSLDLSPKGKQTASEFAKAKSPSNAKEKCVVAVYYLKEIIELKQISARGVFTYFKTVQWVVPADLKNMLQQAGSEGWLDTSDSEDIKLTSLGDNLIGHDLPRKSAKS